MARLSQDFYAQDTLAAARHLLGKYLVRRLDGETLAGRIVETEGYIGRCDKACHAYNYRRTARTETLFAPPGTAYIYLIYGMYHCLNFVTEPEGEPAAVLLRALQPVAGAETMARLRYGGRPMSPYRRRNFLNGPGKVCQALGLTRADNGLDLTGDALFICDSPEDAGLPPFGIPAEERLRAGPRVGVDYAEEAKDFPWRFWLEGGAGAMFFFDMDGVLTDSNGVWKKVDREFLARRGLRYTHAYYEGVAHVPLPQAAVFTKDFCHLEESCGDIIAEWMELAGDTYARVPVKPGVRAYLKQCRAEGRRMAVVTSSVPEHCHTALETLGLEKYFERITFAQELGLEKRTPDIWLAAARAAGVRPEDCTVFDDSLAACQGARAARMRAVGVYDALFSQDETEMRSCCDVYIKGFEELLWMPERKKRT